MGVQATSEYRHYGLSLFSCEGKEFEPVLKSALLPNLGDDPKVLLGFCLRRPEFHPYLPVFRKLRREDRPKAAFPYRHAPSVHRVAARGVGSHTYSDIYFATQKLAHRSTWTLIGEICKHQRPLNRKLHNRRCRR